MTCAISPLSLANPLSANYIVARPLRDPRKGLDFFAVEGGTNAISSSLPAEVRPVVPGKVEFIASESGPNVMPSMRGYGNVVVVRHDSSEEPVPGMPPVFWTIYANMNEINSHLTRGDRVTSLYVLGTPGTSSNGRFPMNPPRLHFEVRSAMPPGNLRRDTIDPLRLLSAGGVAVAEGGHVVYTGGYDNGDPRCDRSTQSIRSIAFRRVAT